MSIFKGSGVAIVTPFKQTEDGNTEIDYDSLQKLIEFHINNSTDSIIICGTTGEAATMSEKEHLECIKKCVEFVSGRIPVIAGTGSNNTLKAVRLSKEAEKLGVDGLLCVTPYYNKTNQNGLKLYYKRISDSVDIPIIMYNVPSRTGVNILPSTAIDIARACQNVVGIKEASGNIEQVRTITSSKILDVYSGNDDQIYDVLDSGGIGVISVLANIFPKETHDIVMEYLNGNKIKSLEMQKEALKLIKALFSDVNPIPIKKALELEGMCSGILREPLIELDQDKTYQLSREIQNYKKHNS